MKKITYNREGDFFIPDLYLEKEDYKNDHIIGNIVETDIQAKSKVELRMNEIHRTDKIGTIEVVVTK